MHGVICWGGFGGQCDVVTTRARARQEDHVRRRGRGSTPEESPIFAVTTLRVLRKHRSPLNTEGVGGALGSART